MITLVQFAVARFYGIKLQDFSEMISRAIALFSIIDDGNKQDYERLLWIEQNTHKEIQCSIYELDRIINPSQKDLTMTNRFIEIMNNEGEKIRFSEGTIQKFLCYASREILQIINKNIKDYKQERKISQFIMSEQEENNLFKGI